MRWILSLLCIAWLLSPPRLLPVDSAPPETLPADLAYSLRTLFSQRFHKIGQGKQAIAYLSEDGQTVVKLFSAPFVALQTLLCHLPLPAKLAARCQRSYEKRLSKAARSQVGYHLAMHALCQASGLIYVHAHRTSTPWKLHTSRLGIPIDLRNVLFVVQKKAEPAPAYLKRLVRQGELQRARMALWRIRQLLIQRCQRGVFDEDPPIHRNIGFVGDCPIFLDAGRFIEDPRRAQPGVYEQDVGQIFAHFAKKCPELQSGELRDLE